MTFNVLVFCIKIIISLFVLSKNVKCKLLVPVSQCSGFIFMEIQILKLFRKNK